MPQPISRMFNTYLHLIPANGARRAICAAAATAATLLKVSLWSCNTKHPNLRLSTTTPTRKIWASRFAHRSCFYEHLMLKFGHETFTCTLAHLTLNSQMRRPCPPIHDSRYPMFKSCHIKMVISYLKGILAIAPNASHRMPRIPTKTSLLSILINKHERHFRCLDSGPWSHHSKRARVSASQELQISESWDDGLLLARTTMPLDVDALSMTHEVRNMEGLRVSGLALEALQAVCLAGRWDLEAGANGLALPAIRALLSWALLLDMAMIVI